MDSIDKIKRDIYDVVTTINKYSFIVKDKTFCFTDYIKCVNVVYKYEYTKRISDLVLSPRSILLYTNEFKYDNLNITLGVRLSSHWSICLDIALDDLILYKRFYKYDVFDKQLIKNIKYVCKYKDVFKMMLDMYKEILSYTNFKSMLKKRISFDLFRKLIRKINQKNHINNSISLIKKLKELQPMPKYKYKNIITFGLVDPFNFLPISNYYKYPDKYFLIWDKYITINDFIKFPLDNRFISNAYLIKVKNLLNFLNIDVNDILGDYKRTMLRRALDEDN